jgi:chromosome partitioning protein
MRLLQSGSIASTSETLAGRTGGVSYNPPLGPALSPQAPVPMRSIAIINQKGGVGKTTTAVNLSAALARAGQRVGLIDIDPQAHASLHLGLNPQANVPTVYDLLTEDLAISKLWQPAADNLHVAASHIDLAAAEVELAGVVGREVILRDKLAAAADQFDYVLIDCPPSLGILTINALAAVDDVFLPLQPHFLALHGLSKLLKTIGLVNERLNDRLQLAGVVLCLYESGTKLAAEVSQDVEQFFREARKGSRAWSSVRLFETRIRRNIRLAEAPSFGQSIFQYAANSPGAEDYRALAGEVLAYYAGRELLENAAA